MFVRMSDCCVKKITKGDKESELEHFLNNSRKFCLFETFFSVRCQSQFDVALENVSTQTLTQRSVISIYVSYVGHRQITKLKCQ